MSILDAAPMVQGGGYSEQVMARQNNDTALQVTALREQTGPKNIDRIAAGVAEHRSPRYRGAFYRTGTINEDGRGVIGGEVMNPGDWVAYLGETEGAWEHGLCYEWSDGKWSKLEVNVKNMGKYTIAVRDLCEGAPNGYFSVLFCKTLVAVDAFIENLYMQKGVLKEGGSIQSEGVDPDTGKPLLLINENGIEAINGRFQGYVEATSGIFQDVQIGGNSFFDGDIQSGPLYASKSLTTPSAPIVFQPNTSVEDIWNRLGRRGNNQVFNYNAGRYGNKTGLKRITFTYSKVMLGGGPLDYQEGYHMYVLFFDNTELIFLRVRDRDGNVRIIYITQILEVGGGKPGMILRIDNIPGGPGNTVGDIYETDGILRITRAQDL